ncbi:MAG: hypothetical protein ABR571_08715 [Jatrophihabitans sp.]|uniref:hypothetical protein n=1 Tax=Jatrophihabitans sp. TaxID=1932789 RepID=UPI00390D7A65
MSASSAQADLLAKSGEAVKSGPIGLAIILILCIACYFLFKSMSRHLKTVREDFPTDEPAETAEPAQSARPSAEAAQPAQSVDPAPPPPAE